MVSSTTIDTRGGLIKDKPKTFREEVEELCDKSKFTSMHTIHNIEAQWKAIIEAHGIDVTNLTIRITETNPGEAKIEYFGPQDVLDEIRHKIEDRL